MQHNASNTCFATHNHLQSKSRPSQAKYKTQGIPLCDPQPDIPFLSMPSLLTPQPEPNSFSSAIIPSTWLSATDLYTCGHLQQHNVNTFCKASHLVALLKQCWDGRTTALHFIHHKKRTAHSNKSGMQQTAIHLTATGTRPHTASHRKANRG